MWPYLHSESPGKQRSITWKMKVEIIKHCKKKPDTIIQWVRNAFSSPPVGTITKDKVSVMGHVKGTATIIWSTTDVYKRQLIRSPQTPCGNQESSQQAIQESAALWYTWGLKGAWLGKKIIHSVGQLEGRRDHTDWLGQQRAVLLHLLPSEEDTEVARAAAKHNTGNSCGARVVPSDMLVLHKPPPPQQHLVSSPNGPSFKGHKYDKMYNWRHLFYETTHGPHVEADVQQIVQIAMNCGLQPTTIPGWTQLNDAMAK